jgi:hypothetical protein
MPKKEKAKKLDTVFISPIFRVSFPNLDEVNTLSGKYQLDCLFEANSDNKKWFKHCKAVAAQVARDKFGSKLPKNFKNIAIKNGTDKQGVEGYEDTIFITPKATASRPPNLRDLSNSRGLKKGEIYGGCYARAKLSIFAYSGDFNGVTWGLDAVQFVEDGERFGDERIGGDSDFDDLSEDVADDEYSEDEDDFLEED